MHANRNHYQSDVQFNTEGNSLMLIVNALIENRSGIGADVCLVCLCLGVCLCVRVCVLRGGKSDGGEKVK